MIKRRNSVLVRRCYVHLHSYMHSRWLTDVRWVTQARPNYRCCCFALNACVCKRMCVNENRILNRSVHFVHSRSLSFFTSMTTTCRPCSLSVSVSVYNQHIHTHAMRLAPMHAHAQQQPHLHAFIVEFQPESHWFILFVYSARHIFCLCTHTHTQAQFYTRQSRCKPN